MTNDADRVRAESLARAWQGLRGEHPHLFARDAASRLGVAEADLITSAALHPQADVSAVRLSPRWPALLARFPQLGEVKTMTRNDAAVLERWGAYEPPEFFGLMGQVVGEAIDLRIFLRAWGNGFAVTEHGKRGPRRSFQFFDGQGDSIHKVYVEEGSASGHFDAIVGEHRQEAHEGPRPRPDSAAAPVDDDAVDVAALRASWDALTDTHEFHGLLRRFSVSRVQALRLAGAERAESLPVAAFSRLFEHVTSHRLRVMVFVGNRGMTQIYKGQLRNVRTTDGWLNVLDPSFNLHVCLDEVMQCWLVRKPTERGTITSLELFDRNDENVLLVFGERKPGHSESDSWRQALGELRGDRV